MNWSRKNGSYPGILDLGDYDSIVSGKWFFARKVDLDVSKQLLNRITQTYKG